MKSIKKALSYLVLYFMFWILISWVDKALFLIFDTPQNTELSFKDIINIYRHGIKLDLSMAAYISALPFLVFTIWSSIPNWTLSKKLINIYTGLVLIIVSILTSVNINLYPEWTAKISKRAIDSFLDTPKEAILTASWSNYIIALCVALGFSFGGFYLYKTIFNHAFLKLKTKVLGHFTFFLMSAFLLFSCIRGGYGRSTLNESMAYYSSVQFYNHAAVNTYWGFINDYVHSKNSNKNPYAFYSNIDSVDKVIHQLNNVHIDSNYSILKTSKPNIVLIVLESYTADLIGTLGGAKEVSPNIDKLAEEGILFTNIYATSDRSDKGIVGIFSGFPAQGNESIIKHIKKHENLPAIGQELKQAGYNASFYYGGQSEFYNFKSYMIAHGIDQIVDIANFPSTQNQSSWGVYDEYVFEKIFNDINSYKEPFFTSIFTINNHEPFDLKGKYKFGNNSLENKFKSTAYYTDSVLNKFVEKAKQEDWYDHTLFIVTADHGHRLPFDRNIDDPKRFHIPLLLFGGAIKDSLKNTKINTIASQTDIAATLLYQLQLPTQRYKWSRNLFNNSLAEFAFFNTSNSWGMIKKDNFIVVDFNNNAQVLKQNGNIDSSSIQLIKAYNQKVYEDFLSY